MIYSICIKYTFNQEDVEDNYQEALINFFKYMDSYDPRRPVKTWIYAVTQRLMTDLNNRNRNRLLPDENVDVSELKSTLLYDDEPSEACLGIDNYEQYYNDDILWALRRLKPIYREPLLLQQAGYKIGEITDILHRKGMLQSKNIETVKSRLFLAKNQLRNLLTRDGEKEWAESARRVSSDLCGTRCGATSLSPQAEGPYVCWKPVLIGWRKSDNGQWRTSGRFLHMPGLYHLWLRRFLSQTLGRGALFRAESRE